MLEVQDDSYTRYFGGNQVVTSDVLDVDPANPRATVIADLNSPCDLPRGRFDCIILSQTLQLIRYPDRAAAGLFDALKPKRVLLATFRASHSSASGTSGTGAIR